MIRLRKVFIFPTHDTTPQILPDEVEPRMRRLVVSDIHMSIADRLDDFEADLEFEQFIDHYALGHGPTELILAGDTFEFLQVRLPGISDYEWSGEAAALRLRAIVQAHPKVFAALRRFLEAPDNLITVLIGNHDFEMHYAAAKYVLYETLALDPASSRLRFGIKYQGGGIYIEHGNQYDEWNRFLNFEGISEPFEVVRGTRVVKEVINHLEDDPLEVAPLIDNVKPTSAFFWYMLSLSRLRQPAVRRYVVRGLLRLFRIEALPLMYQQKPLLVMRQDLLGEPGKTSAREAALQAIYELDTDLQEAAAADHGGVIPEVRSPTLGPTAILAQGMARRFQRAPEPETETLHKIEEEAQAQLRYEIREFKGALQRGMAELAQKSENKQFSYFICGHTHLAEVVPLNSQQTYINIGTWTAIIKDIDTNRYQEQRFPFLEIWYPDDSEKPQARLLVWESPETAPKPWQA
jgi:UDP-2,3-diacylglucosamine pyrophosphatase LpxH